MAKGWSVPPSLFMDEVEDALVERIRAIATAMHGEIISRSPVDTGRFRRNNIVSIGSPVFYSLDAYDKSGRETVARGESVLSGLEPYTVTFIQNNLAYAGALEDGHSRQAPAGIYGIAFYGVKQAYDK